MEVLSISASGGAAAASASEALVGEVAKGGQEAPLDSLLASAAEVGGARKPNAHQVSAAAGPANVGSFCFVYQHR